MAQTTYMEMLMKQLAERPDSVAFRDAEHPQGMTYRELDERSGRVYAWMKQRGVGREQAVLINLPRGGGRVRGSDRRAAGRGGLYAGGGRLSEGTGGFHRQRLRLRAPDRSGDTAY